ncbi:MAG: polysaccharide deacetylase family protein [Lacrimispora sp.]|uniref:polysaccharide deacetylase family protein n=1 Tax=Lacrimispora sp. TaxID=2719234 RepID=UPI0039E2FC77
MKRLVQWSFGLMAGLIVTFAASSVFPAMAEETNADQGQTEVRSGWIDENLGPGVARWVDENGNVSDQPGTQGQTAGEEGRQAGEGQGGEAAQGAQETQGEQAAQEGQETQGAQESQEQVPAGRQIDPAKPMVALTFDDGPYAPVGNQIMDCLALYGGKATFFVVGSRVLAYQAELQRMIAEGHEIGNHTYDHKYITRLSGEQIESQVNRCSDAVQTATGVRPTLFRPPGGYISSASLAHVQAPAIMWSIDTLDWKTRNAQKTVNAVMSKVRDGDIVLMHELYSQSGAAALEIIPRLVDAGYQLVTVSEMAAARGGAVAGGVYSQFYP